MRAVLFAALFAARAAMAAPVEATLFATPYSQRLALIEEVAARVPGYLDPLPSAHRELGQWAGIYTQTKWQGDTGRDALPIWYALNTSLSIAPWYYLQEYDADSELSCERSDYVLANPDPIGAPLSRAEVCRMWKRFFAASDGGASPSTLRDLQWRAHAGALIHAFWRYSDLVGKGQIPDLEYRFWRGWLNVVTRDLSAITLPTTGMVADPLSQSFMPTCGALGDVGCGLRTQMPWVQSFVLAIASRAN